MLGVTFIKAFLSCLLYIQILMKKTFLLLLFIAALTCSQAQIKWKPQWKEGSMQTLEYTYSKVQYKSDTLNELDSLHATIQAKYLGSTGDNYLFQWKFNDFYAAADSITKRSNEKVYEIIAGTVSRCPVIFTIGKDSFNLTISNEIELDSVAGLVSAEMLNRLPNKGNKEDQEMTLTLMQMNFAVWMEKTLYSAIKDYYSIYQKTDLKLNEKQDIKSEMEKQGNGMYSDAAEGFAILEDKDPKTYTYRYKSVLDLKKMLEAMGKAVDEDDSITKQTYLQMGKTEMTTDNEIKVSRPDMAVTSFYKYEGTIVNAFGADMKEYEILLIKAIK